MAKTDRPFSIKMFLPEGNPDGIRVITKSLWTGTAITFPRTLISTVQRRSEFQNAGVYILVGPPDTSDSPMIYIGEGDPVGPRLVGHHRNKDFWTWAIFFTAQDGTLNKAHIQHLESRLIRSARDANRVVLTNKQEPQLPSLSEADAADVDSFLTDMHHIFPLVGLSAFERPTSAKKENILMLKGKGVSAQGYESESGFVVVRGSEASLKPTKTFPSHALRQLLLDRDVLENHGSNLRFTQDWVFTSPSQASGVIFAASSNGLTAWKNAKGKTLKEIRQDI